MLLSFEAKCEKWNESQQVFFTRLSFLLGCFQYEKTRAGSSKTAIKVLETPDVISGSCIDNLKDSESFEMRANFTRC